MLVAGARGAAGMPRELRGGASGCGAAAAVAGTSAGVALTGGLGYREFDKEVESHMETARARSSIFCSSASVVGALCL